MSIPMDHARVAANRQAMLEAPVDAMVVALPSSVLLLSGYWPIDGSTLAIATTEVTHLLTPRDEGSLANRVSVDGLRTYESGSLTSLPTHLQAIELPLGGLLRQLGLQNATIGYEAGPWVQPAPYVALSAFGEAMAKLLRLCLPQAKLVAIDEVLAELQLVKTEMEIARIKLSCDVCARAFTQARTEVRAGATEMQIAAATRTLLMECDDFDARCDGYAFCMSGSNAAESYRFFQHTRHRLLKLGDMALVHCNSHVGGYWTDVTRTISVGQFAPRYRKMHEAILAAREAALAMVKPGVRCADVDAAARSVMRERGYGDAFKTPLGHGVGFAAMDHNAKPRLHPISPDVLREGMVFNVEPGVYIEGECGLRHCDVVACKAEGAVVLTDFL